MGNVEQPQGQPKPLSEKKEKREALRPNKDTEFIVMGLLSTAPNLKKGEEIDQNRLIAWNRIFEKSFKDKEELHRIALWLSNDELRRTGLDGSEFEGFMYFRYPGYAFDTESYYKSQDLPNNPLAQQTIERIGALCNLEAVFIDHRLHIGNAYVEGTARAIEEGNKGRKDLKEEIKKN